MRRTPIAVLCMAGALMLAASCDKLDDSNILSGGNGRIVLNCVAEAIGMETKAEMSYGYDVLWQENDKIYVTDGSVDDTFTLTSGAGTANGQFTEDGTKGIQGNIEAFYPAGLHVTDATDGHFVWPAEQTGSQIAPMYANQTIMGTGDETLSFSSLGAVLQIVFNSTTPDITVTSITIQDDTKPMSGTFHVKDSLAVIDDSGNEGITLSLEDGVEMGQSAKYFNIAVPAGEYQNLTLTFTASNGKICQMTSTTLPEIERNTVCRITLAGEFKGGVPQGALKGKFTVNKRGKQVYFSRGNLQATYGSNNAYSLDFAERQYDFIGDAPGNNNIDNVEQGMKVDLFGWSTRATNFGINSSQDNMKYNGDFLDWGKYLQDDDWRTLSSKEWEYLLGGSNERAGKHKNWVSVNGIMGLVIAPDDFKGTIEKSYTAEDWMEAEESGLVFLPTAGLRPGNYAGNVSKAGYYWSATPHEDRSAYFLAFHNFSSTETGTVGLDADNRSAGRSVRLVADVYTGDDVSLPGLFSVNDVGGQVFFSRGNLQATYGSDNTYSLDFAESQYDFIGDAPGNNKIDNIEQGMKVDLFGWSTKATNFGINTSQDNTIYNGDFVDWGKDFGYEGWRTLSSKEWEYLLGGSNERAGKHKNWVSVNGIMGLVIAPDDFKGTIEKSYTAEDWMEAEESGLVFLPTAGLRPGNYAGNVSKAGYYWSATPHEDRSAYFLVFHNFSSTETGTFYLDADNRATGRSVRLVKDK